MGLTAPKFRVTANSADITASIAARLISLRLTDELGFQSDMLEIHLSNSDPANPIQKPPKGAELEVWLGYDGAVQRKGMFVVDEIETSGWPKTMTIRARAAAYEKTPLGKTDLQTQKVRDWPDQTKLGDMVAKIAKEHGMEPAVAKSLKAVVLPHLSQTEESDISFLVRVLKQYDAVVKPAGGKLAVAKRGESQSTSGAELATIRMAATECTSFRMTEAARESPGTVVAYWHNKQMAKKVEVVVGSGDPVKRIRHHFPNAEAAQAAAQGDLDKRTRAERKLSVSMPGNAALQAEGKLTLAGFGPDEDGEWLVQRVEHEITNSGYTCHVDCEKPADAE